MERPSRAKASEWLSHEKSGRPGYIPCETMSRGRWSAPPRKNVRRRRAGCHIRSAIICRTNRRKSACSSASVQSAQPPVKLQSPLCSSSRPAAITGPGGEEVGLEVVAVQPGDELDADLFRAGRLALAVVRAAPEPFRI